MSLAIPRSILSPRISMVPACALGLAALWLLYKRASGKPKPHPVIRRPEKEDHGVGAVNVDGDDKVKTGQG